MSAGIPIVIGANTKYILSTSGRPSSSERYRKLLQDMLQVDVAYLPINSGDDVNKAIDPQRFVWALKGMPCIGGAISRDIKHSVVPFLDELDESAVAVQSVNTVIVGENGRLKGYNTDVLGFRIAIQEGIKASGIEVKRAVCYGYGGVASVVVSVLSELGIEVYFAGRNMKTASERATELNVKVWNPEVTCDLFVNATPASESALYMASNFLTSLHDCKVAFDHEMPGKYLKKYCVENKIYHIDGNKMYYPQMEAQWGLFLKGLVEEGADIASLLKEASTLSLMKETSAPSSPIPAAASQSAPASPAPTTPSS